MTIKAEITEEDLERKTVSLETLPSPSAPWLPEGVLGSGDQMAADSPHPEQSGQEPGTPVPGEGTGSSNSEMANQDPALEQGTSIVNGGNDAGSSGPEVAQGPASPGQLSCSGAEGTEPDQGYSQEGSAPHETPKGEGGISNTPEPTPTLATPCVKTWASVQDLPDPRQTPREAGGQAECKWDGPECAPLGTAVIENMSTDAPETTPQVLGVARPGIQANTLPFASPMEQIPQGWACLSEETTGGRGEAEPEDKPSSDMLGSPAASQAVILGNQESTLDAPEPGHPALDMGPGIDQTQVPGPAVEWPERAQLGDTQAVESEGQHLEGGDVGLSPGLLALSPLEHRAAADGPFCEAKAHLGSLEAPTPPPGPLQQPLDSAGQAEWAESMELDFLPDSQLQDALDASNLEVPPEQENESGLGRPGPKPGASWGDRVLETEAQPRMEDASNTVCGLIVELSNLNRMIMSAHRDLEAFKRLGSRKARPSPCLEKGTGAKPWGEQPWRDL